MKTSKSTIIAAIIIPLFAVSCVNQSARNQTTTTIVSEDIEHTKNFEELGFSITTPCQLNDVSSHSSGNFVANYGGVVDENDASKMAAYQVIVTKLPIGYKNLSKSALNNFIDNALRKAVSNLTNVEKINFSYNDYPGYVGYSTHNGLKQKGVMFSMNEYIIALTLMTNYNLEERFNKFTNGFKTLSSSSEPIENSVNKSIAISSTLPEKFNHSRFSFNYPSDWAITQQNAKATSNSIIAVQIMDQSVRDDEFASNINVIISDNKYSESSSELARISYNQVKEAGLSCHLNGIKDVKVGGRQSSVTDYTASVQGFRLRVLQYIVKRSDNTTLTITLTLDNNKYSSLKRIATEIINSFTIK